MRSLVFTADDFGKSELANKNILNLAKSGKVQRISVMVRGNISRDEINKLLQSKIKLDIHLEIPRPARGSRLKAQGWTGPTAYPPAGRAGSLEPRANKITPRLVQFIFQYLTGKICTGKVEMEWTEQIEEFRKIFGRYPDGLNSHENVHFFPSYFKLALKLCQKFKIPYIRMANKGVIANGSRIGWILKLLNLVDKRLLANYQLPITNYQYLASLDWIKNDKSFLDSLVKPGNDRENTTEIVCHPERREEYAWIKKQA